MNGVLLVGAFGISLVAIGMMENAGLKINEGILKIVMESAKFGGILYILKLAATTFLQKKRKQNIQKTINDHWGGKGQKKDNLLQLESSKRDKKDNRTIKGQRNTKKNSV